MEPEYSISCATWTNWQGATIEDPWLQYVIVVPNSTLELLSVGTYIQSFSEDMGSPITNDITPLKVAALVYKDNVSDDIYTIDGAGRTLIGFLITDANDNLLTLDPNELYEGPICFYIQSNIEEIESINCYQKLVWNKQKNFSVCVEKYLNQLNFGMVCCSMLEELKMKRRILQVLNRYDVRDIPDDTTDYNKMSYCKVNKLLNCITTC